MDRRHTLGRLESFFLDCVERGQADGTITATRPAAELAHHLLGVLMGVRVLARVRPERPLLEGVIGTALASLSTVLRVCLARFGSPDTLSSIV